MGRVLQAGDGAEAERLMTQHGPAIALALVDCSLPDIDGAELCERVRTQRASLPVLLMSGREQSPLARKLAMGGPVRPRFLAKPFLPGDVMREVQTLLAKVA